MQNPPRMPNILIKIEKAIDYLDFDIMQNGTAKVLDTPENLEFLLKHFRATVRYNLMSRRREITLKDVVIPQSDFDNNALAIIEGIATLNKMPVKNIDKWLELIAHKNSYHPIVDMIKENPWDKKTRLDDFIKTIKSKYPEIDYLLIKTWMVAAMAAAHSTDGFMNHGVLVLQGSQGIGKTSWVKSLNPLSIPTVRDSFLLDPRDKDSVLTANRYWLIELGELDATFARSDIARLKSFITTTFDDVRAPYARKSVTIPRRSGYIATVNDSAYLVDRTGNRRWWTVSVESLDYDHNFDMRQVWAEVYQEWQNGYPTYLDAALEETLNKINEDHEKIDPLEEILFAHYDWESKERKLLTCTEILQEINWNKIDQLSATNMGRILTKINGKSARKTNGRKVHEVPAYKKSLVFKS